MSFNKGITLLVLVGLFAGCIASNSFAEEIVVDSLKDSEVGQFPAGWKTYPFQKNKATRVYRVAENSGKKYLQADDEKNISVPIMKDFFWDAEKYPYLKFEWRAQRIPKGSKETRHESNDSACGVYVGFSRTRALKYVWSDLMTPGSYWAKKPGAFAIISKENGSKNLKKWRSVTVNVPKDYKAYFQKPMEENPIGIGVMTDGNALQLPAACDYRNFRISTEP